MKNIQVIILLLITAIISSPASGSETTRVQAELESYDRGKNIVVFNGMSYALKIDINKSDYSPENQEKKLVKSRDLKEGNMYYFTLHSDDDSEVFKQVIFISQDEPEA